MIDHIIQWCNAAQLQHLDDDHGTQPPYQTTDTPFLKLLITFKSLFLAPSMSNQPSQSFHHLLSHRFELLKTGNFQDLYNATRITQHSTTETPPQKSHLNHTTFPFSDNSTHHGCPTNHTPITLNPITHPPSSKLSSLTNCS
jgi:hypothetical protein